MRRTRTPRHVKYHAPRLFRRSPPVPCGPKCALCHSRAGAVLRLPERLRCLSVNVPGSWAHRACIHAFTGYWRSYW